MKRTDLTSGIKPPKFRVGRFILNEYEAREMVSRIAEGKLNPEGIVLKDSKGHSVTFDKNGYASSNIYGWDVGSAFAIRKFKANMKAQVVVPEKSKL